MMTILVFITMINLIVNVALFIVMLMLIYKEATE